MECPDDVTVTAWIEGTTDAAIREQLEQHLDSCDSCRILVAGAIRATRTPATLGRFVLAERLGVGAMGEVYAARDPRLGRRVALKLPRLGDDAHVARLLREARMMARVSHPNVVAVHEVGSVDDVPYIVMEQVDGSDLAAWRRERERDPAEVVAVVAAVARGLAAVHRVGLVHRDVKPANILIDREGRARLGDFGLAGAELHEPGGVPGADALRLTQTGEIVGTPAYMAPEQLRGERATPASDQFALCVVLYELLFAQRPFAGDDLASLTAHVLAGELRELPRRAPPRVARAIRRGLATDPAARFPSVATLADALAPRPARRAALIAVPAVALGGVAIAIAAWPRAAADPCGGAAAELAPAWNPERAAELAHAFAATGQPYAAASAARVIDALDRYGAAWLDGQRAACVANRVRATESDAQFDRRAACLADRRRQLAALADALGRATPAQVERASSAALALPAIAECEHPLADDAIAPQLAPLADRAAALDAQYQLGDYKGAVAAADALAGELAPRGAPRLSERVLGTAGLAKVRTGDAAGGEASLRAALDQAARAHDDAETVRLWGALINVVGYAEGHPDRALAMVDAARLALVRAGGGAELEARLDTNVGVVQRAAGDVPAARASLERALALTEQVHGKDAPEGAVALASYANVLQSAGEYAAALAIDQRLVAIQRAAHGEGHPLTAQARANYAALLEATGDHARAAAETRAALAILERAWGPEHRNVLLLWNNLGVALGYTGDVAGATAAFHHALAAEPRQPMMAADALNGLAKLALPGDPARAVELLQHSLRLREASEGADHPDLGITLVNLADALRAAHDCKAARADYDRALGLLARLGKDHPYLAIAREGRAACSP
ncbi:MAG TPA: serine/threonine-protein kinase [Kofleriaceae bacterium]|nr:serine/threonine-protein kinase [Kofleriaceae bacterium]